jgi:hypothetical protein
MLSEEQKAAIERKREEALRRLKRKREQQEEERLLELEGEQQQQQQQQLKEQTAGDKCERCGNENEPLDETLRVTFDLNVCVICARTGDEYELIPLSVAKDAYLLPAPVFRVLKFYEKDNPHHRSWTKMKLYLKKHVVAKSLERWGTFDALEEERRRRMAVKHTALKKKVSNIFKREGP